jgi:hypothetical protein
VDISDDTTGLSVAFMHLGAYKDVYAVSNEFRRIGER